jgi:hypothetical protein
MPAVTLFKCHDAPVPIRANRFVSSIDDPVQQPRRGRERGKNGIDRQRYGMNA